MANFSNTLAKAATKLIDNLDVSKFGGNLEKAQLDVYEVTDGSLAGKPARSIPFYLNPHTVSVTKEAEFTEESKLAGTIKLKYAQTKPVTLSVGEMWFDTYDTRESVREQFIDHLEELLDYNKGTHVLNAVVFTWGQFSQATKFKSQYVFLVCQIKTDYVLFLPDGTPCRAKVALTMHQLMTEEKEGVELPKESPDHARIYTVKRGDTMQGISKFAYNTPTEWRRIAASNRIDDPMELHPGMRLVLPPILK